MSRYPNSSALFAVCICSVNRVAMAINPTDIQEICVSIYLCISAAGAAVSNSVLGKYVITQHNTTHSI